MGRKEKNVQKARKLMEKPKQIRNIGTAAHIDHGKTTLSDNLIAGAGMMSEELAGKQLMLDFDEQEQERGITIDSANVSMVHDYEGDEYLINLVDTPGHVDFGGDVTRAMRAVDGVIIVVCAVEGVMPQTETVIRQALKEKVKPILFINKVDRLIKELNVGPEEMQQRFHKIIRNVDELIKNNVPEEFEDEWRLNVEDGNVAFGSALQNWAISVPYMEERGITFKEIYEHFEGGKEKERELLEKAPLHEVLLNQVIKHMPNPIKAQKYRIPNIWRGDTDSDVGQTMIECSEDGPTAMMVTKILMDEHAGEIAVGRLFGGKIQDGMELHIADQPEPNRVQQVSLSVGADRISVDEIKAGNVVAISGLRDAIAGSTVSSGEDIVPFEEMKHYSEPVVTKAVEAKNTADLPKLIEVLRSVAKADPSVDIEIDQETGEHLISGMGELHLEITEHRIEEEHGVPITSSEPIVVYREMIEHEGGTFMGISPNRHNRFFFDIEPLEEDVVEAIDKGDIKVSGKIKNKNELSKELRELGMDKDESKNFETFENSNVLLDMTKGIQYLNETMELIEKGFEEVCEEGPLAREPCKGVKVKLVNAKLHEDTIHRGPAQVMPAVKDAIYGAMCQADRVLLEPKQKVFIDIPSDLMGNVNVEIQQRRGEVIDMSQEGNDSQLVAKCPVSEMFGFSADIRSATGGKALWSTEHAGFEEVPGSLQPEIVKEIRERKGLNPEPFDESHYVD
ncbi:MAG: elongation factor EF-2 [Candidatus Thermoplasmatota archaeon]|nr:elongation factor EF-2 [Candidatus Thermoplasmatota archaeon]